MIVHLSDEKKYIYIYRQEKVNFAIVFYVKRTKLMQFDLIN